MPYSRCAKFSLFAGLLLIVPVCSQQGVSNPRGVVSQAEGGGAPAASNEPDVINFTLNVNRSLPEFRFKITLAPADPEHSEIRPEIQRIEVLRGNTERQLQLLTGCDFSDSGGISNDEHWFSGDDLDFDGYRDVFLLNWAGRNSSGCVWLYDSTTGLFEYSQEFSRLTQLKTDSKTRSVYSAGAAGGGIYGFVKYAVKYHHLVEVEARDHSFDEQKKRFRCVVIARRGGQLMTIYERWEPPDADPDPRCGPF
jgi:hypothetical protein